MEYRISVSKRSLKWCFHYLLLYIIAVNGFSVVVSTRPELYKEQPKNNNEVDELRVLWDCRNNGLCCVYEFYSVFVC